MGKKPAKCFKENAFTLFERNSGRRAGGSQLSAPRATRFGNWSWTNYRVHYVRSMGGSDPAHYIWAALSPKMAGRYRPNRGFRSRSFFSIEVRTSFLEEVMRRPAGERYTYL